MCPHQKWNNQIFFARLLWRLYEISNFNCLTNCWCLTNILSAFSFPNTRPPNLYSICLRTCSKKLLKIPMSWLCDPQLFGTLIISNYLLRLWWLRRSRPSILLGNMYWNNHSRWAGARIFKDAHPGHTQRIRQWIENNLGKMEPSFSWSFQHQ